MDEAAKPKQKSKAVETLVAVMITFITTLALNTGTNYLFQNKATVVIGDRISSGGLYFRPVEFSNHTNLPMDGVLLVIPKSTHSKDIAASAPVQITEVADNAGTAALQRIRLSGIAARRVLRLLIPVTGQSVAEEVDIANASQTGLDVVAGDKSTNLLREAVNSALIDSILYASVMGVGFLVFESRVMGPIRVRQQELAESAKALSKELDTRKKVTDAAIEQTQNNLRRMRLLLLSRLDDHRRELSFWRDTTRKALYGFVNSKEDAESLFRSVTETLKTYGTRESNESLETIVVLANMLSAADRVDKSLEKPGPDKSV